MSQFGHSAVSEWLRRHPAGTFFLMLFFGLLLGLSSYNLFALIKQNVALVVDYGWMALMDGALVQMIYLLLYGIVSLACTLGFKVCEKILVERIMG